MMYRLPWLPYSLVPVSGDMKFSTLITWRGIPAMLCVYERVFVSECSVLNRTESLQCVQRRQRYDWSCKLSMNDASCNMTGRASFQ